MLLHSGLSLSILIMLTNASRGKSDDRPWEEQEVSAFFLRLFLLWWSGVSWILPAWPMVRTGRDT